MGRHICESRFEWGLKEYTKFMGKRWSDSGVISGDINREKGKYNSCAGNVEE